jgi:hypothetical protein
MRLILLFGLLALTPGVNATPVLYQIDFDVESVTPLNSLPGPAVGDTYEGFFSIDSSGLAADGINRAIPLLFLAITIREYSWCFNLLCANNVLVGFRGPGGFGTQPGFDVVGGEVVNLRGGVFGESDPPLIDFSTDPHGPLTDPDCSGLYCGNAPNRFSAFLSSTSTPGRWAGNLDGAMRVVRVPEPTTLLLLAAGLFAIAPSSRWRGPAPYRRRA